MGTIKVNLGSGERAIKGWINIDNSPNVILAKYPILKWILYKLKIISKTAYEKKWSKNIKWHNVRKGLPFASESVDFVYCSHLLEHFTREEAKKVCQDVLRTLKPKGIFRVIVPDLELAVRKYIEGDKSFFKNERGPIADRFMSYNMFHDFHKWAYDSESLRFLLEEVGFDKNKIFERNCRKGEFPDLEKIEYKKRSIYMETVK